MSNKKLTLKLEHDHNFMIKLGKQLALAYEQFGDLFRYIRELEAKEKRLEKRERRLEDLEKILEKKFGDLEERMERLENAT